MRKIALFTARPLSSAPALLAILSLMAALPGGAGAYIVINNGLAPPSPANVIGDGTYSGDYVLVRNVGCPPGGHETDPCPSPGDPTEVELTIGGAVKYLYPRDTSTVTLNGGEVDSLWAQDFSTITMNGAGHCGRRATRVHRLFAHRVRH